MEVALDSASIETKQDFGDVQLHMEWATPEAAQSPGNSGAYLMGLYEVQIYDSRQHEIYADGQAAAVYGQYPTLANASRAPGQWQSYDIIFRRPRFDEEELVRPARVTVFHNGVLVQDHVALTGPTAHKKRPPYQSHEDRRPLMLQNHDDPVRFRNIWIRDLERYKEK